jgi:hypothetical protein
LDPSRRRIVMAEEKEKAIERDHESPKSAPEVQNELSDKDVDKVAGGCQPIDY